LGGLKTNTKRSKVSAESEPLMSWLKKRRRKKLRQRPFPPQWQDILEGTVWLYRYLPPPDRQELHGHIHVFLAEKRFEGARGLTITDEVKLAIAAQACLLLLHRETNYYPGLYSIVVYPHSYLARQRERDEVGTVREGVQPRSGESWSRGVVVLAWDAVAAGASGDLGCHNVVLHEFAHQLDYEDGVAEGSPALPSRDMYRSWSRVLGEEYRQLRLAVVQARATLLDKYGATSPAEFFAVVTEYFFMCPRSLKARHPELYEELTLYYKQDPAALVPR